MFSLQRLCVDCNIKNFALKNFLSFYVGCGGHDSLTAPQAGV